MLDADGNVVLKRHRPYYESKVKTEADKPSIREQHEKTGSGRFLFDRKAAEDYETALTMVGGVPLIEIAKILATPSPRQTEAQNQGAGLGIPGGRQDETR